MAPDQESASGISNCTDTVQGQLNRYIAEFEQSTVDDALGFWAARRSSYKLLAPLAEDLLAAPASQAFVESIFSACLCGSLAQCALSLKRLSAMPGFNPQTRQNKLFQDYRRSCFEINFSDRQEGLTVSSIICDR